MTLATDDCKKSPLWLGISIFHANGCTPFTDDGDRIITETSGIIVSLNISFF